MIPCLYDISETAFTTNGIGKLADCISCLVTEKRNGSYELKMEYPTEGIHAESLVIGNLIYATPACGRSPQAFRIYKVITPIDGRLEIAARHISYQLSFTTVSPCTSTPFTEKTVNTTVNLLDDATADTGYIYYEDGTEYFTNLATSYEKYQMLSLPSGTDRKILIYYYALGDYVLDIPTFVFWDADGNYVGEALRPAANTIYSSTSVTPPDNAASVTINLVTEDTDLSAVIIFTSASNTEVVNESDGTIAYVWDTLVDHASTDVPFSFETDIEGKSIVTISDPVTLRSALGGVDGSMLDTFGGEFEWDMYKVRLLRSRGLDNGVKIVYGKNLTDFRMEKSIENTITDVHPYWKDPDTGELVELGQQTVTLSDIGIETEMPFEKIAILDCSEQWDEAPTEAQLLAYAQKYLKNTSYTEPDFDIDIDFTQIWRLPDYEEIAEAEQVNLCNTVHIYVTKLDIELAAVVTETVYNVLLDRYSAITLSSAVSSSRNTSLTLTVAQESQVRSLVQVVSDNIKISASKNYVGSAIEVASNGILMSVSENYVGNSEVRTKFAMDSTDITLTAEYGAITFETGSLIVDAGNFTLDAKGNAMFSGKLNAASGTFVGSITNKNTSGSLVTTIANGQLAFSGTLSDASIDASQEFDYYDSDGDYIGSYDALVLKCDGIVFDTKYLNVPDTLGIGSAGEYTYGWTGRQKIVYDIDFDGETVYWTYAYAYFINGLECADLS